MARITVEDCLKKVDNRFALIHLAAKRVRDLRKGSEATVMCKNEDIVVALREIAAGKVFVTGEEAPDRPSDNPDAEISQDISLTVREVFEEPALYFQEAATRPEPEAGTGTVEGLPEEEL